jgi:hypothetical protein
LESVDATASTLNRPIRTCLDGENGFRHDQVRSLERAHDRDT